MSDGTDPEAKQARRGVAPPEVVNLATPALNIGLLTGSAGLVTGVVSALRRDLSPGVLGLARAAQWGVFGTVYWSSRSMVLKYRGNEVNPTSRDKIEASAIGGTATGSFAGLLRGPRNIIPAAIVFTIGAASAQFFLNYAQSLDWSQKERKSIFESKWSPLRKMSDGEYLNMMDEKVLRLDAEIALIDDKIAELRAAAAERSPESASQNVGFGNDKGEGQ